MEIPTKPGVVFHMTTVDDGVITAAVNHLEGAFHEWMKPAWDAQAAGGGVEAAAECTKRGVAFIMALRAQYLVRTFGAPESVLKAFTEASEGMAECMIKQREAVEDPKAKA